MLKPTMRVKLLYDSKFFKKDDETTWYDTLGELALIGSDGKFEYVKLDAIATQSRKMSL